MTVRKSGSSVSTIEPQRRRDLVGTVDDGFERAMRLRPADVGGDRTERTRKRRGMSFALLAEVGVVRLEPLGSWVLIRIKENGP